MDLAGAHNIDLRTEGVNTNDSIKQQLQSKWPEVPAGYGVLKFSNSAEVYSGIYMKYNEQDGVALFVSPGYGIIRTLTVNSGNFNVLSHNNYDMIYNRDVTSLPAGKYFLYDSKGVGLPEEENFFCEVYEADTTYKTIKLIPSSPGKQYFYLAKRVHSQWQGWEKYSGVLM